jgi:hypothetical protein
MARDGKGISGRSQARGTLDDLPSAVRMLPTPRTSDTNGPGAHGDGGLDLRTAVTLLPTPTTQPTTGNGHARNLGAEIRDLLPTPVAHDSGNTPEDHLRKKPGREVVTSLTIMVENDLIVSGGRLPPTPVVTDSSGARRSRSDGTLYAPTGINLNDVAAGLSGDRTPSPSAAGNNSSADPHQHQPTNGDASHQLFPSG